MYCRSICCLTLWSYIHIKLQKCSQVLLLLCFPFCSSALQRQLDAQGAEQLSLGSWGGGEGGGRGEEGCKPCRLWSWFWGRALTPGGKERARLLPAIILFCLPSWAQLFILLLLEASALKMALLPCQRQGLDYSPTPTPHPTHIS